MVNEGKKICDEVPHLNLKDNLLHNSLFRVAEKSAIILT